MTKWLSMISIMEGAKTIRFLHNLYLNDGPETIQGTDLERGGFCLE